MAPAPLLKGRYELGAKLSERGEVVRYRGVDRGEGPFHGRDLVIVRMVLPPVADPVPTPRIEDLPEEDMEEGDTILLPLPPVSADRSSTLILPAGPHWPSVEWERQVLGSVNHPALPRVIDSFVEEGYDYLVEEIPTGQPLWDAWDDPEATAEQRFTWLRHLAEALQALHERMALLEGLRPEIVVVSPDGLARLTDLSDLLPMPVPPHTPLRGTLYTAPELLNPPADTRADLYSFGALLYSLHLGRELTEIDFEGPGAPKSFLPRFPDAHPLFGRLISKTFVREPSRRFPTDEANREDATGFLELLRALNVCRRTLDNVRLEVAAWTTTGMVRSGNEDAFTLLHAVETRQDELAESALVLLADGMGGYEAGEVAAALALQALRQNLSRQPLFRALFGGLAFPPVSAQEQPADTVTFEVEACKQILKEALKDANKQVQAAAREGIGRRGMGCTAEVVYVTGQHVVVGHVGDSRTYHLHQGRLIQLTRDHTLVGRLVELGALTAEEAEVHPRRNELHQAIGGHADVDPGLSHGRLLPGDWVVVCSDGVSNHIGPELLTEMLQGEATSAEMAARRLVNLVNIEGATDNATVVVIRAT
jgi:serine/threonine protein phosphatase PrpC